MQQFTLLGSLTIDTNGTPSPIMRSHKGCALLTYLLVEQQPQSRENVADLLWDSTSTTQSLTRLRILLSRTRKWIPELVSTRQSLQFRPMAQTHVDLYVLNEALATDNVGQLDKALKLYKGDLMQGFILEDGPRFNEWLLLQREQVRQQVTAAYQKLCQTYADQKQWTEGIMAARRWLALDDLEEKAVRWLIRLLAGEGQVNFALQEYENLRQRLWQELGVEPETATADLAQHLTTQPTEPIWPDMATAKSWQAETLPELGELSPPGRLPPHAYLSYHRNNDFQGRKNALCWLAEQLLPWPDRGDKLSRAIAITGMGGLGKTQLAVEYCYRYGRYYEGGVYWLSFADAENVGAEVAMVGSERGMRLYSHSDNLTQTDQISRVQRAWQETTPRLLIFDNCEEEALLKKWLPVTGGCHVLLTSRRGTWARELGVTIHWLNTLTVDESTALIQQLAPGLAKDVLPFIQEIATELGNLPLALHLAGSFLRRYQGITPQQYLTQLGQIGLLQHPSLQGRGSTHSPTNHELNVARTFAINFEQLDSLDATDSLAHKLLVRTACFAPGEPIATDMLLAMVQDGEDEVNDPMTELLAVDGLARLVTLGFLRAADQQTVIMHHLVAKYIKQVLDDEGAQTAVEQKIIKATREQSTGTWALATRSFPPIHLRYAMEQSLSRQDMNAAYLVSLWGKYLGDIGNYEAAEQQLLTAQQLKHQILGTDHPETAEGLFQLGRLYIRMGNYELSKDKYEHYLAFWEQAENPDMIKIAKVTYALGNLNIGLGNSATARSYLERALTLRQKYLGPNHPHTGFAIFSLGALQNNLGDLEAARVTLEKALKVIETSLGELSPDTANVYDSLGKVYLDLGDSDKAWDFAVKAFNIRERILGTDHIETAFSFYSLGRILIKQARYDEALAHSERALHIREEILKKDHPHLADSYHQMGTLLLKTGSQPEGVVYMRRALAIREHVLNINHHKTASILIDLGEVHENQEANDVAYSHYVRALAILEETAVATHPHILQVRQRLAALSKL